MISFKKMPDLAKKNVRNRLRVMENHDFSVRERVREKSGKMRVPGLWQPWIGTPAFSIISQNVIL